MALYTIKNKFKVYQGEKSAEPKFRIELSKMLIEKFGKGPHTQIEITEIIRFCLDYYSSQFINICQSETSFFFYQTILMFNEDAIELSVKYEGKTDHQIVTGEYLAIYRRILKFILEAGCNVEMKIIQPKRTDVARIEKILDDLLFLGEMIFMCVTIYAEQGMIEDVGDIKFNKDNLYVFSRRHHYNAVFDEIKKEWGHSIEKVVVDKSGTEDLFNATERCLGVHFSNGGGVIGTIHSKIHYSEGVLWENLPQNLHLLFGIPFEKGVVFFKGLTLSRENKMTLIDLACKPNNLKRHLYRPILVWNVNGKDFTFIGPNSWTEAIMQLTTNAIPWGKGPEEWMQNKCFKEYVHRKEDAHDKWLDDEVEAILKQQNCYYERNAKKLHSKGKFVDIDIKGLGEIDFIIIAHDIKKIFLADCKHLMGRYDAANQKNDFNAFTKGSKTTKSYNETMANKVNWFSSNIDLLESHFNFKGYLDCANLSGYTLEGIFIINTPTLYMYNSRFRIYMATKLPNLLDGSFKDKTFIFHNEEEKHSSIVKVSYPYFKKPSVLTIDAFDD